MPSHTTFCPCGSGDTYQQCCFTYHQDIAPAPTAEHLMRSRFTAYAMNLVDYLIKTTHPGQQAALKKEQTYLAPDNTEWTRLEILHTESGQKGDKTGVVEFKAWFRQPPDTTEQCYQERSDFIQENGRWYFIYPNLPQAPVTHKQPGRNDSCPCGSGQKFKKCCLKSS